MPPDPRALLHLNTSPAAYALRGLASSMAYADDTWGEDDLWPVVRHLGIDMTSKWAGAIPERDEARDDARRLLLTIREPEVGAKADRILQRYLR